MIRVTVIRVTVIRVTVIRTAPRPVGPAMSSPLPEPTAADAAPNTVPFSRDSRPPAARPVPSEAASLAAIERRLGELVRAVRLAAAIAAVWLLWEVFGGGVTWVVSAATWAVGGLLLALVILGTVAYLSPRARRGMASGLRGLFRRAAGRTADGGR